MTGRLKSRDWTSGGLNIQAENLGAQGHCGVGSLPLLPFPFDSHGSLSSPGTCRREELLCAREAVSSTILKGVRNHGSNVVSRQEPKLHFHRGSFSLRHQVDLLFLSSACFSFVFTFLLSASSLSLLFFIRLSSPMRRFRTTMLLVSYTV